MPMALKFECDSQKMLFVSNSYRRLIYILTRLKGNGKVGKGTSM